MSEIAACEAFVRAFHARWPGVTGAAYGRGRAPDGRSSYALCAEHGRGRVLDLGCGDGALLAHLGPRAIGIDLSGEELRHARGLVAQARAEALPFADGAFDACLSHLVFSILPDPAAAAHEVARVLAPGGVFAIVTGGAPAADDDAFAWLFALARPYLAGRATPRLGDRRARHAEGLDGLLAPAGFAPCTWQAHTIDLGGAAEEVWRTLATIYELAPLDDDQRARLHEDFLTHAGAARVPCAMRIAVAAARKRPLG